MAQLFENVVNVADVSIGLYAIVMGGSVYAWVGKLYEDSEKMMATLGNLSVATSLKFQQNADPIPLMSESNETDTIPMLRRLSKRITNKGLCQQLFLTCSFDQDQIVYAGAAEKALAAWLEEILHTSATTA
ncbi:hypothetical protein HDU76_007272 [Blyttiomyces sp. JEL0837]|nr:hypothetical protein HDU76_007272 [Blyttiomyces sp. JEL0837]